MIFSGLFSRERNNVDDAAEREKRNATIRERGTPTRAVVTDVICKRNGWVVMAVYEDRWLGTQNTYKSDLLTQKPCVYVGGEVIVYVDEASASGNYFVDC